MVVEDIDFYTALRALFYFIVIACFIVIEYIKPFHHLNDNTLKKNRLFNWRNGLIVVMSGRIIILALPLTAAYLTEIYKIGLHYWINIPNWLMYIIWFVVLDLIVYFSHRLVHWSDILWEFHKIHHSEKSPNVTTTLRVHPIDYIIVNNIKVIAAFIFGPTFFQMLFCDLLITILLTWEHCNIKIPKRIERLLAKIVVIPKYHIYHHTNDRNNYNFATAFVIWDKLTNRQILPYDSDKKINQFEMGLPDNETYVSVRQALYQPFIKLSQQPFLTKILIFFWLFCIATWILTYTYPSTTFGFMGTSPITIIAFMVIVFHISMVTISIYLHRSVTHHSIHYVPWLRHFFRFWLWFTTGIDRKHWAQMHQEHHKRIASINAINQLEKHGINNSFWNGLENHSNDRDTPIDKNIGFISDIDWLEKHIYSNPYGFLLFYLLNIMLFGVWGIPVWILLMTGLLLTQRTYFIKLATVQGYRNFNTNDSSKNRLRIGILASGEELQNNHHQSPKNPRFSRRSNEFDAGWLYISLFVFLGMARLRRIPNHIYPRLV